MLSYIPPRDADFEAWFLNFSTLIAADPTDYGLVAQDGTDIGNAYTAWNAAYVLASNPTTRTSPAVADKDAARVASTTLIRSLAARVQAWPSITDMLLSDLGLTVRDPQPTPIAAPNTFPLVSIVSASSLRINLRYADELTPASRKKPFGATQMQLFVAVAETAVGDPDDAAFRGVVTKNPFGVDFDGGDAGKVATFFARWQTRTGLVGPWSSAVSMTIPAAG